MDKLTPTPQIDNNKITKWIPPNGYLDTGDGILIGYPIDTNMPLPNCNTQSNKVGFFGCSQREND
jgi:hypothetical protein